MRTKKTIIAIIALLFISIPVAVMAADTITVEGTFQGANCMFYNKTCPMNMPAAHIALEPDFVLVTAARATLYIPNLDKSIKVKYLHIPVRVKGSKTKETVHAETLEVKKDGKYKQVWSLADEQKEREMMERH